jgi:hypothetical protein
VTITAARIDNPSITATATLTVLPGVSGGTAIRINCGGPGFSDAQARVWATDPGAIGTVDAGYVLAGSDNTVTFSKTTADMQPLFRSARYGHVDASFAYQFPVTNGSYTVTLYWGYFFSGTDTTNMNVLINGSTVLQNFNVSTAAGKARRAYSQSFPVTVSNGTLRLDFNSNWPAGSPWADIGPWINGIEIASK